MKKSLYQQKAKKALIKKTISLYKRGMTYRQIEPLVGRSRQWISVVVRKYLPGAFN